MPTPPRRRRRSIGNITLIPTPVGISAGELLVEETKKRLLAKEQKEHEAYGW